MTVVAGSTNTTGLIRAKASAVGGLGNLAVTIAPPIALKYRYCHHFLAIGSV